MPETDPFSAAAIAKSVHDTLAQAQASMSPDAKRALIIDATGVPGQRPEAHAMYVQRVDRGWQVLFEGGWKGGHDFGGKVAVLKEWK